MNRTPPPCRYRPTRCLGRVALSAAFATTLLMSGCGGEGSLSEEAHLKRAEQQIAAGEHAAAIIEYRNALRQADRPSTRAALGVAYQRDGSPSLALTHLERALEAGEPVVLPLARAHFQLDNLAAIAELPPAYGLTVEEEAELLAYRALGRLNAGETAASRATLDEARALNPGLPLHAFVEAQLAIHDGDAEGARAALNRVLAADASFAPAWSLLADLAWWQGKPEAAIDAYDRAIELRPERVADRLKRGEIALRLGRFGDAATDGDFLIANVPNHPGGHFLRGWTEFERDAIAAALPHFENALAAQRNFRPVMPYLAAIHLERGNLEQANHLLQRHRALGPTTAVNHQLQARLHVARGEPAAARELLEKALTERPELTPLIGNHLASLYFDTGNFQSGIELLRTSLDEGQGTPATRRFLAQALSAQGEHDEALALFDEGDYPEAVEAEEARGIFLLRARRYEEAETLGRQLVEDRPQRANGYNILGASLLAQKQFDSARSLFQQGVERSPESETLAMNLAQLELRLGHRQEAIDSLKALQRARPGHPPSALQLAGLALADGNRKQAASWLEAAIEHHPDVVQPHLLRARIALSEGESARALTGLNGWLNRHPEDRNVRHLLGEIQLFAGQNEDALATYQKLLAQHEDDAVALNNLAWLLREKAPEQALVHAQRAVELAPGQPNILDTLGVLYLSSGEVEQAREVLEEAYAAGSPTTPGIGYNLARAHQAGGDHAAARSVLRSILEEGGSFPEREAAQALLERLDE